MSHKDEPPRPGRRREQPLDFEWRQPHPEQADRWIKLVQGLQHKPGLARPKSGREGRRRHRLRQQH